MKFMIKKISIYVIMSLLIIVAFGGGYYFGRVSEKRMIPEIKTEEGQIQTLQLKPNESEYRLGGIVVSVDATKTPGELVIFVISEPDRFITSPPPPDLQRTILVLPHIPIVTGRFGPEATLSPIKLSDLKQGDNVVMQTYESILDLLNRDTYNAVSIRRVVAD